jgi:alpha-galactosidase
MKVDNKDRKKIVVIGAGSASFGLETLAGIMRTPTLHGMELALVDTNLEGATMIKKLAGILNERWGSNMKISATGDRKVALPGADYVIISFAFDREKLWKRDREIALRHGIHHHAECGGPGGFFHAARNISAMMPMMEDIKRLCPKAFILCYTNPMHRLCTAIHRLTDNPFTGVSHADGIGYFILGTIFAKDYGIKLKEDPGFYWTEEGIEYFEKIGDLGKELFEYKAAGMNHFTWMLDIRERGTDKDLYGRLRQKVRAGEVPANFEPLTQELIKIFDYVPVESDNHIVEYLPNSSNLPTGMVNRYDIHLYDFDWSNRSRTRMWKSIEMMINGQKDVEGLKSERSEKAEAVIEAMETNSGRYECCLNIPNRGSISNLPQGAIVQVPGIITSRGVIGMSMGELPKPIAALVGRAVLLNEMSVEAVIEGNMSTVYQAFTIDPNCSTLDLGTIRKLADEYVREYKEYLPTFQ